MAFSPIYKYFCFNGEIQPVEKFIASENEGDIYEVLRVVNGVPLFLEDHLSRFSKSVTIAGKTSLYSSTEIQSFLKLLIRKNKLETGNVLISFKNNLELFFIAHKYPSTEDYTKGVKCGVLHAERENPNAKVFQTSMRQQANELIADNAFFEVLLVDKQGHITEGSRSNVFFIKGNEIITPKAKKVLLGITRKKTLQCAAELGFSVNERNVDLSDFAQFDAVFLTGTSPKILPVNQVAAFKFDPQNIVVTKLMDQFNFLISEYIKTVLR